MTPVFKESHTLTPFAKNKPALKKPVEKAIPQTRETAVSNKFLGQAEKELMTPAANQATPIFERNSAISLCCPTDNFFIWFNDIIILEKVSTVAGFDPVKA